MGFVGKIKSGGANHPVASTLYGVCSNAANEAAKIVEITDYDALIAGTTIHVKFIYTNTAASPTLNVNGTGALPIYVDGVNPPGNTVLKSWPANSVISFTYDGTAWRMNDTNMAASNNVSDLLNLVYPVGAIYISTVSTSPATLFGGTWEQIQGRFLLGTGANAANTTDYYGPFAANTINRPAGELGGESAHQLTTDQIPSHTHTGPSHTHTMQNHTHTMAHTHTGPSHSHGLNSHTHSIPALGGTAVSNGAHVHEQNDWVLAVTPNFDWQTIPNWGGASWAGTNKQSCFYAVYNLINNGTPNPDHYRVKSAGAHTHTVSTSASTTGGSTASTAAAGTGNTGAASNSTTSAPSNNTTSASGTANTGATGGGAYHNNMPPYLAVYMWKRVS